MIEEYTACLCTERTIGEVAIDSREYLCSVAAHSPSLRISRAQNSVANLASPPPSVLQPPRRDQCLQTAIWILAEQPPTYHMSRGIKSVVRVDCGPWRAAEALDER